MRNLMISLLALMAVSAAQATPKPMMMLDDATLGDARVDYLTGLEQQRSSKETGEDDKVVTDNADKDMRRELPVVTPAAIPASIPLPSKGISVQVTPR